MQYEYQSYFGDDNQKKGLDIEFSLKGKQIKNLKKAMNETYQLLGKKKFYRAKSEEKNKIFRRSIFISQDIKKGEKFSNNNIKRVRPSYGLPPIYYEKLLNKKSPTNLHKGNPLKKSILKKLKIK